MMGSRANAGTDAMSGLLALVSNPEATAAKLTEIKTAMDEMAATRTQLHADQAEHAEKVAMLAGYKGELELREKDVREQREAIARELAVVEKAKADLEEREAGFVERDKLRDAKALTARHELREAAEQIEKDKLALHAAQVELDDRSTFTANVLRQAEAKEAEAAATIEAYKARVTALQSAMSGAV